MSSKLGLGDSPNLCLDKRLYVKEISKGERAKQESFVAMAAASGTTKPPMGGYIKLN